MTYEEQPVEIVDKRDQVLRTKTIPLVKVLWRNQSYEEATWEKEEDMLSRPDPERIDTWQPSRVLEWDPVSQAPSKDSQGIMIFTRYEPNLTFRNNI